MAILGKKVCKIPSQKRKAGSCGADNFKGVGTTTWYHLTSKLCSQHSFITLHPIATPSKAGLEAVSTMRFRAMELWLSPPRFQKLPDNWGAQGENYLRVSITAESPTRTMPSTAMDLQPQTARATQLHPRKAVLWDCPFKAIGAGRIVEMGAACKVVWKVKHQVKANCSSYSLSLYLISFLTP
jgi:hypothetical protein